jgi:helicase MOV-10
LKVPGLAEKRPSIILGDRILVKPYGVDKWYEGYVHVVEQQEVGLRFNRAFNFYAGQKYHVRFKLNRLSLRRMHQAMDTVFNVSRIFFPTPADARGKNLRAATPAEQRELVLVNRKIGENPPQLRAVAAIVRLPPGSPPFVIFGPWVAPFPR